RCLTLAEIDPTGNKFNLRNVADMAAVLLILCDVLDEEGDADKLVGKLAITHPNTARDVRLEVEHASQYATPPGETPQESGLESPAAEVKVLSPYEQKLKDRNEWMYHQRIKGMTWSAIKEELDNNKNRWPKLSGASGVKMAVDSYADENHLNRPPTGKAGRPRHQNDQK
ncbi:MAG: hypothetical protein JW829_17725, partial [Pirellulales bacterium]|nr:hypothetical protein [Pirellulales bacterium]